MLSKKLFILLLIFFLAVKPVMLLSQPDSLHNPFVLGLHGSYGFIIPHARAVEPLSHSNPFSFELNLALHLTSENIWKYCFCYPRIGAALHYVDFGNRQEVGSAIALYPYVEPFIGAGRRISMAVRFGPGVSYQTNIYDEIDNPRNLFFGAHFAFIAMLNTSLNIKLNENMTGRFTFSYNHISNGGTIKPNYGINYPLFGLGLDYTLNPYDFEEREKNRDIVLNPDRNRFDLAFFFSGREGKDFERWFGVYGIWGGYSRMVGRVSAVYTGAEFISDRLIRETVWQDYIDGIINEVPDHKRFSVLLGHELVLGNFIFSQYAGFYLYAPVKARNPWYQRYALLYSFAPSTWIGINAKSHYQVIDFIDLRLVRSF
ncbi:MAG: acyloxyacyl hydrolase [Bacteroidales bacterium]|nr:acyloxyacyl hydrolase [Bacteroidales bacterium]